MAQIRFFKVATLPGTLEPDSPETIPSRLLSRACAIRKVRAPPLSRRPPWLFNAEVARVNARSLEISPPLLSTTPSWRRSKALDAAFLGQAVQRVVLVVQGAPEAMAVLLDIAIGIVLVVALPGADLLPQQLVVLVVLAAEPGGVVPVETLILPLAPTWVSLPLVIWLAVHVVGFVA